MTKKRLLLAVVTVFFCLASVLPAMAADPAPQGAAVQPAGKITALLPLAKVIRGTGKAAITSEAKKGDQVVWEDLVKTEKGGRARITLNDNSVLSVGSQSELRITKHDARSSQTSLELTYGRVRAEVTKITRDGGKFEVKTPTAVAGVIGTDFGTISGIGETTFICITGEVDIMNPAVPGNVLCGPGQVVTVRQGNKPSEPEPATPQQILQLIQDTEPATVSALTPSGGLPGMTLNVSATGMHLGGVHQVSVSGDGVSANLLPGGTPTSAQLQVAIADGAAAGPRTLMFNKPNAEPGAAVFMVMESPEGSGDPKSAYAQLLAQQGQLAATGLQGLYEAGVGFAQQQYDDLAANNAQLPQPIDLSPAQAELNANLGQLEQQYQASLQMLNTAVAQAGASFNQQYEAARAQFPGPDEQLPPPFWTQVAGIFAQVLNALQPQLAAANAAMAGALEESNQFALNLHEQWMKTIADAALAQHVPPAPAIKNDQAVDAGGVANFDGSGSQGGGGATIQSYLWELCQPGTNCTPIAGYSSTNPEFDISTCALAPGEYPVRLTVVDSNNQSASAIRSLLVISPGYETPEQRVQSLTAAYNTLQPESFLSFFDNGYPGLSVLQENIRQTFELLQSMTINLRVSQASINCADGTGTATVRTDWQAIYAFKNNPSQVISDPSKQVTVRLTRMPGRGWFITDLQGDNGTVQGVPPGPVQTDDSAPNLQILSVVPVSAPAAAAPVRNPAIAPLTAIPPGTNTFTATVSNSGTAALTSPISILFSVAGVSTSVDLPLPLAVGAQASVSATLTLPSSLPPGTVTTMTVTVNPACAAPELPADCVDNTFNLELTVGQVDLAVNSITTLGLIGTVSGIVQVGVQNLGDAPSSAVTLTVTSAAFAAGSATGSVPALNPGQSTTVNVSGVLANVSGAQSFTASVPADSNTANNSLSVDLNVTQAVVDLEITDVAVPNPLIGTQQGTLQVTLTNLGNVPSQPSTGNLRVAEIEGPDLGTANIPSIAAAAGTTVVNLLFTTPNVVSTDLVVFISPAAALDSNSANDSFTELVSITPTVPDYQVADAKFSGRPTGATGANALQRFAPYDLLVTVGNSGTGSATETLTVEARCFPEPQCDNTNPPTATGAAPAAGTSTVITVPLGSTDNPEGAYTGDVTILPSPNELNTANNTVSGLPFEVFDFAVSVTPAASPQNLLLSGLSGEMTVDLTGSGASAAVSVNVAGSGLPAGVSVGLSSPMVANTSQTLTLASTNTALSGTTSTLTVTGTREGVNRSVTADVRLCTAAILNKSTGLPGETSGDPLLIERGNTTLTTVEFQVSSDCFFPAGIADISVDPNAAFTVLSLDAATATVNGTNFTLSMEASASAAESLTTVIIRGDIPNTSPARQATYTLNVLPFSRPNLTITALAPQGGRDFSATPWLSGEPVDVNVTVENVGLGTAAATTVDVFVNGSQLCQTSVSSLVAGAVAVLPVHCVGSDPMSTSSFSSFYAYVNPVLNETDESNQYSPFLTISTSDWTVTVSGVALSAGGSANVTPATLRALDSQSVPNSLTWVAGNLSTLLTQSIGAGSPPQVTIGAAANAQDGAYVAQVIAQMKDGALTTAQRLGTIEVTVGSFTPPTVTVSSSVSNHVNTTPLQLNGPLVEEFTIQAESPTVITGVDLLISDPFSLSTTPNFIANTTPGVPHLVTVGADIDAGGFISSGPATSTVSAVAVQTVIILGPVKNDPVGSQNTLLYYNVGDVYGSTNFCYDLLPGTSSSPAEQVTIFVQSGFNLPSVSWQWLGLPAGVTVDDPSGAGTLGAGDYGTFNFVFTNSNPAPIDGYFDIIFAITISNAHGTATRVQTVKMSLSPNTTCAMIGAPVRNGPVPGTWMQGAASGTGAAGMTLGTGAPARLPDVRIDARDVSYSPSLPRVGDTVALRFRLTNAGDADAVGVPVSLSVDGRVVATDTFDVPRGRTTLAGLEWNTAEASLQPRPTRNGRRGGRAEAATAMLVVDPAHTVRQKTTQEKSAPLPSLTLGGNAGGGGAGGLGAQRLIVGVPEGECVGVRLDSGATAPCGTADLEITVGDLANGVYMIGAPEGIASLGVGVQDASRIGRGSYTSEVAAAPGNSYAVQLRGGATAVVTLEAIQDGARAGARAGRVFAGGVRRGTPGMGRGTGAVEPGDTAEVAPQAGTVYFRISYGSR